MLDYLLKQLKQKLTRIQLWEPVSSMENQINQAYESNPVKGLENQLWQYVSQMDGATVAQMSSPSSREVTQVMERHIMAMLGALPEDQFEVTITTNRENLGRMLAGAMFHGYFLKAAEQRLALEQSLLPPSV